MGVAEEVGQLCDDYVEVVYGDEFLTPPPLQQQQLCHT